MPVYLALLVVIGALLAIQEPPIYPPGWFCSPRGTIKNRELAPDHPCHCQRMASKADSCEHVTEDARCLQWCHVDHCACPVTCVP